MFWICIYAYIYISVCVCVQLQKSMIFCKKLDILRVVKSGDNDLQLGGLWKNRIGKWGLANSAAQTHPKTIGNHRNREVNQFFFTCFEDVTFNVGAWSLEARNFGVDPQQPWLRRGEGREHDIRYISVGGSETVATIISSGVLDQVLHSQQPSETQKRVRNAPMI